MLVRLALKLYAFEGISALRGGLFGSTLALFCSPYYHNLPFLDTTKHADLVFFILRYKAHCPVGMCRSSLYDRINAGLKWFGRDFASACDKLRALIFSFFFFSSLSKL
jgi:hypothetical protein